RVLGVAGSGAPNILGGHHCLSGPERCRKQGPPVQANRDLSGATASAGGRLRASNHWARSSRDVGASATPSARRTGLGARRDGAGYGVVAGDRPGVGDIDRLHLVAGAVRDLLRCTGRPRLASPGTLTELPI